MYFCRIGIDALGTIQPQGALFPAVPQLEDQLHELLGAIVALIMAEMAFDTEILRLAVVHGSHDIPGCTAIRQMIDRAKLAGEMIGLIVGGRTCCTETDVPRGRRKRAQNRHRIHAGGILIAVANPDFLVVAKSVGNREAVRKKDQVKFPLLELTRHLDIIFGREKRHLTRRISPKRMAMGHWARDQKPGKIHMAGRQRHSSADVGPSILLKRPFLRFEEEIPPEAIPENSLIKINEGTPFSRAVRREKE